MSSVFRALSVPLGVVGILLLLIVPIPVALLDVLIIINILFALVILLTTMFITTPLEFSVFPSLLLVATLFRLGLNVASTRLVLGEAHAGAVIEAFGSVAVGGSLVIGAVVFLILVVIQFVVVTKGAERVAEVGARFTLDAMPGKQMAIDAELNTGAITEEQARERRAAVAAEADFYGAMDGASKFVKGDAIAGVIIIIINVVGGIAIGMIQLGMEVGEAVERYTLLTIGDGLVTQIPALLMAVATGLIVTRATANEQMGSTASRQLTQSRQALMIAGCAAIVMAIIPGMPPLPFILVGGALMLLSLRIARGEKAKAAEDARAAVPPHVESADTPEQLIEQMRVHALEIQLAPDVVDLVTGGADDLLGRVRALRRTIALDLGIVIPPVRTRDSAELPANTYVIRVAGVEAGRGTVPSGRVLALGERLDGVPGTPTTEPVFGLPGFWVAAELRHAAELAGATVIDRTSVVITHLSSIVTTHAPRLLSREDVRVLTEGVRAVSPSAVDELTPALVSLAEVHRVLQLLLAERVPITDLARIYEALALRARASTDVEGLVEAARTALGPVIAERYREGGVLSVVMFDPLLEQSMLEGLRPSDQGSQIVLDPSRIEHIAASCSSAVAEASERGLTAVVVCAPALRPAVRRLVNPQGTGPTVLSYQEASAVPGRIDTVGVIRFAEAIPS